MKKIKKLTLLHSNDLHGDFFAGNINGVEVGGLSLLSGYLNKIRKEEPNVVYAIAGDMFRGSVIDSEFKGISTIEMMNMLSPDVATIGNHEIDYGISHLLFIEKCAKFPIINANLYIKPTGDRLFSPCRILHIDGIKILVIGLVTEEVMAQAKQDSIVGSFIGTKEAAEQIGKICNTYNSIDIDFTIILTHIGIEEDKKLAELLDPAWGVDIIIGGHSHTFMEQPICVNNVVIAHAGTGTDNLGRFDIDIDTESNCIDSYKWEFVHIDENSCVPDLNMEKVIRRYKEHTDEKYGRLVTTFPRQLTHPQRNRETELGNLFADVFQQCTGLDVMLLGSGSIRLEELGPVVTYKDLCEVFPYDDELYMAKVKGKTLRHMLTYMLRDEAFLDHTEFYQISGNLKLTYSRSKKEITELKFKGHELEADEVVSIGVQAFHFSNINDFFDVSAEEISAVENPRMISTSCTDILDEYLSANPKTEARVEKRIEITD